ncbi:unnamed protein product, partial [Didymodactylos carnosus]
WAVAEEEYQYVFDTLSRDTSQEFSHGKIDDLTNKLRKEMIDTDTTSVQER